jgi:hypothetical protein
MDPGAGRFVSVDPYGGDPMAPVSLHRYLYSNASPVSFSDPTGNISLIEITAGLVLGPLLGGLSAAITLNPITASLQTQPDNDGYITFLEAAYNWKHNSGTDMDADLWRLDLSRINVSDFDGAETKSFNLSSPFFQYSANLDESLIYGRLDLRYLGGNMVESTTGRENFSFQMTNPLHALGNGYARIVLGKGTQFNINLHGQAWIED